MLGGEHLRFNQRKGEIHPRFVDVENQALLRATGDLIDLYAQGEGESREGLAEMAQPVIASGYRSPKILKGLDKLLQNRCEFREPEAGLSEFRMQVLQRSAELLSEADMGDLTEFRRLLAEPFGEHPDALAERLYADLPNRQPLVKFRPIKPGDLLNRYNVSQVQGLLLRCEQLTATIHDDDPGHVRLLLRHLKFQQLLAEVRKQADGAIQLTLDGPLSVLMNTNKYGLQLALFFPALLLMKRWRIEAKIQMRGKQRADLALDESSGLKNYYRQTTAYRPPAFDVLAAALTEAGGPWRLLDEPPLLDLGRQELLAADFAFAHESGTTIPLEMFHRWHRGPLLHRLAYLGENAQLPLCIGVDRALAKEKDVARALEQSTWFAQHGFLFSDLPPLKRVIAALESWLAASDPPIKKPGRAAAKSKTGKAPAKRAPTRKSTAARKSAAGQSGESE
ncbi:DUF790 family protein [Magnetofaba australis]|uniref:DUF790 family protein n=1 Tax=Magnetofaba australis IT-1 TaxID=1434232 RepID=A0A1Y2K256_9PROT|nr:DUF790 family protein [Magnetofaba australis]OSM02042.1 hypothetical protein MAIT1_02123 [Magnetofaba australis IT-1]